MAGEDRTANRHRSSSPPSFLFRHPGLLPARVAHPGFLFTVPASPSFPFVFYIKFPFDRKMLIM